MAKTNPKLRAIAPPFVEETPETEPVPNEREQVSGRQHFIAGVALFLILIGIYNFTFLGYPLLSDEFDLLDSSSNLVNHGNFDRTSRFFARANFHGKDNKPGFTGKYEPMQIVIGAAVYAIAQRIPNIGLIHSVWMVNILVVALTCVIFYWVTVRYLGYRLWTAWLAGLLLGTTTMLWVYSQYFLREPLIGLLMLLAFVVCLEMRQAWLADRPIIKHLVALMVILGLGVLTKQVILMILPGLALVLYTRHRLNWKLGFVLGIFGMVALALYFWLGSTDSFNDERYNTEIVTEGFSRSNFAEDALESFLGYQFSPTRSIWFFSPILFLVFPGMMILWREKRDWQLGAGIFLSLTIFCVSYGIRHGHNWWGGWGWGPRYMVPLIPMLMLLALPVIEKILLPATPRYWKILFWALVVVSIGVQFLGLFVPFTNYYSELHFQFEVGRPMHSIGWAFYTWTPKETLLYYNLTHFGFHQVGWRSGSADIVPFTSALLVGVGVGLMLLRNRLPRPTLLASGTVFLALLVLGTTVYAFRDDPRYVGGLEHVKGLIDELNKETNSDDVVYLDRHEYVMVFLNYFKSPAMFFVLREAPGERYSAEPAVGEDEPLWQQAGEANVRAVGWGAEHYDHLWLVAGFGPFIPDKVRPMEHVLVSDYYPVRTIEITEEARAIEFYTGAFAPEARQNPQYLGYAFERQLRLAYHNLPEGTTFHPGDVIPVTTVWRIVNPPEMDYNLGVQLIAADGRLVAQRDGAFQDTFGFVTQWVADEDYLDNDGIQIPPDLPPGKYRLQVVVYRWQDGTRLIVRQNNERVGDVAVLEEITIQ